MLIKLGDFHASIFTDLGAVIAFRQCGSMGKSFNARFKLDKSAKFGHLDDRHIHNVADPVFLAGQIPRIGRHLFQAQRDTLLSRVDVEDFALDIAPLLEDLFRMLDFFGPGHIRNMDHSIDPLGQSDKSTEVGQSCNLSFDDGTDRVIRFGERPGVRCRLSDA